MIKDFLKSLYDTRAQLLKLAAIFVGVLLIYMLSGCATAPEIRTVTKTQFVLLTPPATFLQPTAAPAPARMQEYMAANWATRAQLNAATAGQTYKSLQMCNADKESIQSWISEQSKLYDKSTAH